MELVVFYEVDCFAFNNCEAPNTKLFKKKKY